MLNASFKVLRNPSSARFRAAIGPQGWVQPFDLRLQPVKVRQLGPGRLELGIIEPVPPVVGSLTNGGNMVWSGSRPGAKGPTSAENEGRLAPPGRSDDEVVVVIKRGAPVLGAPLKSTTLVPRGIKVVALKISACRGSANRESARDRGSILIIRTQESSANFAGSIFTKIFGTPTEDRIRYGT